MRVRLVAVHVDWGRVVQRLQHFHRERVPLHLIKLFRHVLLTAHTLVVPVEPGGETGETG